MLIRCEKCSTLYELDEKLLPPQGAPVQCSKCQFVFKAYPGSSAQPPANGGAALPEAPPQEAPVDEGLPRSEVGSGDLVRESGSLSGTAPPPRYGGARAGASTPTPVPGATPSASRGPRTPLPAGDGEQQFTADGRPIRKVPFPTAGEVPMPGGARPVLITSPGRAAPGRPAAAPWVVALIVLAVIVAAALVGWRLLRHRAEPPRPAGHSSLEPGQRAEPPAVGSGAAQPRK